jgi:quercetin dioxygenase-like cupin family protein
VIGSISPEGFMDAAPKPDQLGPPLPALLQPEDGASFWRPLPTNGYVTVKTSPAWGGPEGVTMGIQVIPPGGFVPEHSHEAQIEILFCYEGAGHIEVDGTRHPFLPGTTLVATPWLKHKIVNDGAVDLKMSWTMLPPGLERFFAGIGRPRAPGETPPAPFERPRDADAIQQATGFGDLQR